MPTSPFRRFLAETRRRRVPRVVIAYLVIAWIMLQVGDVVVEPLGLPDGSMRQLIVLAALGFPVAVVLAWVFDLTPDGVERTVATPAGEDPAPAPPRRSSRASGYVGLGMLIGLVVFGAYAQFGPPGGGARGTITSVAVLPFVNLSGDAENEYFSDGVTEELLEGLARVDGLRVPARTSSFQFKGEHVDVREVGRRLNVQAVLEGSVRREGGRVRITTQLVDATTGYRLWSETYERELAGIFALQDEIARAIIGELRLTLAPVDARRGTEAAIGTVEAHDLYLLGRYHFHRRGPESLHAAERHFRAAIAADPGYAPAYAGLALTYAVLPLFDPNGVPVERGIREGTAAAQKALALDPMRADAHAALGQIAANFAWDWQEAERRYARAVELAPNDPVARQWRAEVLVVRGHPDAPAEIEKALALDPLSAIANSVAALAHLLLSRDHARSADLWRRVQEIEPEFPLLLDNAPFTFAALGDWDEVRDRLHLVAPTRADSAAFGALVDAAAARARGETVDDLARERALDAAARFGAVSSAADMGAALLAGLVDSELALGMVDELRDDPRYRHPLTWVRLFWFFDPLHDDPRYQRLAWLIALPEA
jgi:adenylate cyclase